MLKTRFLTGLTVIAGTLTAISLGIKKTLGLVALFAGNVGRVAFGGLLKVGLKGVQVLLAGLVKKAALLGGGILAGGGIKGFLSGVGQLLVSNFLFNRAGKFFTSIFKKPKLTKTVTSGASRFLTGNPFKMFGNKNNQD